MARGPEIPPALAVGILALILGGAGGYYARYFGESPNDAPKNPVAVYGDGNIPAPSMPAAPGAPGGGGRSGGGGMMGGMGGAQPQAGTDLARLVRNLSTLQKVQGKGLTSSQLKPLLPTLKKMQSAEKISEADAKSMLAELEKATEPAKEVLTSLSPQRGGGGGGMGGGMTSGNGRPPGGPGGGGPMSGGMGGGGGRPDPEKPFASERNKAALDDLLKLSGG